MRFLTEVHGTSDNKRDHDGGVRVGYPNYLVPYQRYHRLVRIREEHHCQANEDYSEGFTDAELAEYRPIVYKNVLDSAQAVILSIRKKVSLGLTIVYVFFAPTFLLMLISPKPLTDKVLVYRPDSKASNSYFPQDNAEVIHQLWKDLIITKIMDEHSSEFYLMDSAA